MSFLTLTVSVISSWHCHFIETVKISLHFWQCHDAIAMHNKCTNLSCTGCRWKSLPLLAVSFMFLSMYSRSEIIRFKTVSDFGEAPITDMSSEIEAAMQGLILGEGSSQADWENLFKKCPDAREIILDSVGLESTLACRLVCKEWRVTVNYYRRLWAKISKVCSMPVYLFWAAEHDSEIWNTSSKFVIYVF